MDLKTTSSIQKALQQIGLSEKEATIYITLTEIGQAVPSVIAKKARLKRPTAYIILENLVEKGLVGHSLKRDQRVFSPVDPSFLLEYEKKKLKDLENVLPELNTLKALHQKAPRISLYEGDEGIIQILDDSLTATTEIYCWSNTGMASSTALHAYHPFFLKEKIKKRFTLNVYSHTTQWDCDLRKTRKKS